MAKVIAICNQKGGVGKTTTAVNVGIGLAMEGNSVLLVDLDADAHLTTALGWPEIDDMNMTAATLFKARLMDEKVNVYDCILHHEEGVDVIPGDATLAVMEQQLVTVMSREQLLNDILEPVKDEYDYILLDCNGSLNVLTINALAAADSVIIPVQAQYLATKSTKHLLQTITSVKRHINPKLDIEGILITMAKTNTILTRDVVDAVNTGYGKHVKVFQTIIPECIATSYATVEGKSVFAYDRKSTVAKAYKSIVDDVNSKYKELAFEEVI